jgi:hypothetical protein
VPGEAMPPSPITPNMKNLETQINGKGPEWDQKCEQLAADRLLFALTNFDIEQVPICMDIAKKHGYELQATPAEPRVCHFIPTNYGASKITTPDVFLGNPED